MHRCSVWFSMVSINKWQPVRQICHLHVEKENRFNRMHLLSQLSLLWVDGGGREETGKDNTCQEIHRLFQLLIKLISQHFDLVVFASKPNQNTRKYTNTHFLRSGAKEQISEHLKETNMKHYIISQVITALTKGT